jgi:hypothetical protein
LNADDDVGIRSKPETPERIMPDGRGLFGKRNDLTIAIFFRYYRSLTLDKMARAINNST